MKNFERIFHLAIIIFCVYILVFTGTPNVMAEEIAPSVSGNGVDEPDLPDFSHQYLGAHAAESHGNTPEQIGWISQGAYDEDHQLIPTFGWHSWDPDTGAFWWSPTGDGPALERANTLFWEAVALYEADQEAAWLKFGQSLHLLQDVSTPAHAHADSHICLGGIGDCDAYETWLDDNDLINTWTWINANPPGSHFDIRFYEIPKWEHLTTDLANQLEGAYLEYGERGSAKELWEIGPTGIDPVLFQMMFLMAENADNYNSGGIIEYAGEAFNGDLDDPIYLGIMRDSLFPLAVMYSTVWIDYFEFQIGLKAEMLFFPLIAR